MTTELPREVRSIHLVFGLHMTATEKRHVKEMLNRGMNTGQTAKKHYTISDPKQINPAVNRYNVVIITKNAISKSLVIDAIY